MPAFLCDGRNGIISSSFYFISRITVLLELETDARTANVVSLTESTRESYNRDLEVINDEAGERILRLTSLTPVPTNSNGVIEYEIRESTFETLSMVSVKPNLKTGNSVNEYLLSKL